MGKGTMAGENWSYIGVDRDGSDWIAVGYSEHSPLGATVYDTIDQLWAVHGDRADRIVVDVPIGLCSSLEHPDPCGRITDGELSRHCDDLARTVIGSRSSSVFTAPCRTAVELAADGAEYSEVNETNREHTGKGLMQQAANIAPCIVEVDELLRDDGDPDILVEGHPVVCFRAFGDSDLDHSKKTAPGVDERLSLLESTGEYERGTWRQLARELADEGYSAGLDDLLDALALAVTAGASSDELQTIPPDPPEDDEGLPMQMVYRRDEPFEVD
jgi:predicted RNase H-like nuclease